MHALIAAAHLIAIAASSSTPRSGFSPWRPISNRFLTATRPARDALADRAAELAPKLVPPAAEVIARTVALQALPVGQLLHVYNGGTNTDFDRPGGAGHWIDLIAELHARSLGRPSEAVSIDPGGRGRAYTIRFDSPEAAEAAAGDDRR